MGELVAPWGNDDGGVLAGLLVLVLVATIAYGGYWGYQYWDENQDTTPAAASVPPGGEKLSGKGVNLVIPRGWSQQKVSDKEIEKRLDAFIASDPDGADQTGIDLATDPAAGFAFFAIEDKGGKGLSDLSVAVDSGDAELADIQSFLTVQLERTRAKRIEWEATTLGGVEARQVDYQRHYGTVTAYQRQYVVVGDKEAATLTFSSIQPIDNRDADAIADTMRVD
jgi:hypothetical protein